MHYPDDVSDVTDPRGDLQWGTIPGLVEDAAARFGETEALVDAHGPGGTTTRLTFDQLAEQVAAATRAVVANGIERGDRVAIWAPNCAEWVIAALGAVGAGAVLVPLNTRFKGAEAAYILRQSGARLLFTVEGFLGTDYPRMLDEAVAAGERVPDLERVVVLRSDEAVPRPPTAKGDPVVAWDVFLQEGDACSADVAAGRTASITGGDLSDLVFTSGTTGNPKGAMTTHGQTLRTFATWSEVVGLRAGDRYLIVNPFFHTFGYKAGILACLMAGATMVPEPVFDVSGVVARIGERTHHGAARAAHHLPVHPRPPGQRRPSTWPRCGWWSPGPHVVPVELVQATVVGARDRDGADRLRPDRGLRDGHHVPSRRLRRGHRRDVGAGHPRRRGAHRRSRRGRGPEGRGRRDRGAGLQRHARLLQRPGGLRARPSTPTDGCTPATSGSMDEDGNVTITDRLKDMYVSGGFNVYPAEIEAVLRGHPAVGQVAVIGVPDRRMGEVGLALVVPAADAGSLGRGRADRLGPGAPGQLQGAPVGAVGGRAPDECRGQGAQARAPTPVRAVGRSPMSARPHSGSVGGHPSVGCNSNRRNRQEREGCRARHRLHR